MEQDKKKIIMIVLIVVCIAAAIMITVRTSTDKDGIGSIKRGTMMWIKCRNPQCENEWQMDKQDYFEYLDKNSGPSRKVPPIPCPKCSEGSGYRAIQCEKCQVVFEKGTVPNALPDKCPKCGFSPTEATAKPAADSNATP